MPEANCDIGLIGLAVMGQNLVLNMNDHGYKVAVFNRTVSKVDDFLENEAQGTQVAGAHSIQEMCAMLKKPLGALKSYHRLAIALSAFSWPVTAKPALSSLMLLRR